MFNNAVGNSVEHRPLPTTREERGRQIAKRGGIRKVGARFAVPSQSPGADASTYLVDLVDETCTCPDYELRRRHCKHYEAVLFWIAWEGTVSHEGPAEPPAKRKTYRQSWPAYNAAQTTEKERVEMLLKSLCEGIEEPERKPGPGRPRIPRRDAIFAAVMKVYSTFSGRRASTDIRGCAERGHIADAPHYNSIFRCLEDSATTEILSRLIEQSAAPLAEIENIAGQFAQDSTGFSTVTYDRWFDQKHGKLMAQHAWVKLHVMIGTTTNVVTGVKVSDEADCPLLPELLQRTTQRFKVKEVSGDKAYLSKDNLKAIEAVGAVPFIPFKINSVGLASKSAHWRRMWAHFSLKSEDFLARYHRRSNAESTMWMIKSKFGGSVRSKLPVAQVNEVLAKVLCHNLVCIVHAITEFGIEADFTKPAQVPAAQPVSAPATPPARPVPRLVPMPTSPSQLELL
ncbi:transposase [Haliangium sp. UPWRP_2]|uniref:transposase n=1 Tax=Haliangium sp. UPWRP_2 TaxID=1931276 RepID=UPI000B5438A5|nr:transposase [Haliangium sp. UPWRP_2]PSM31672.1 transposase [Haliangium sp. UPWRP_2]